MSCCGTRNFFGIHIPKNFDRCHSFLLALSATGSARKRPHFDTTAYKVFDPNGFYTLILLTLKTRNFFIFKCLNCINKNTRL